MSLNAGLHPDFVDLENLYKEDMENNNGFRINTSIDYAEKLGDPGIYEMNSIFNWRFDIPRNSEVSKYLYRCECGKLHGSEYNFTVCDVCDTMVERQTFNVDYRGWITLPLEYRVLTPHVFSILMDVMRVLDLRGLSRDPVTGSFKRFSNLSEEEKNKYTLVIDRAGDIVIVPHEYSKLTFVELVNDKELFFDFISKYHIPSKGDMADVLTSVGDKYNTFCIPVISTKFRPISIQRGVGGVPITSSKALGAGGLNSKYIQLSGYTGDLKAKLSVGASIKHINKYFCKIQLLLGKAGSLSKKNDENKYIDIWSIIMNILGASKYSKIRGEIFGIRFDKVARSVLEPLIGYRIDEGIIHMDAFRSMYVDVVKPWIIKNTKINRPVILRMFNPNHILTKEEGKLIYEAFKELSPFYMLINRPPTIYYSSISAIKIADVSMDKEVLQTSPFICGLMASDHDGDELPQFPILGEHAWEIFEAFKPQQHILDYKGNYNPALGPVDIMYPLLYKMTTPDGEEKKHMKITIENV